MSGADSRRFLWQPLGPDTTLHGEVIGAGRVTGRITMLAVHPDGQRVYAASANGGVWYSGDGGEHWRSLDGLADTPAPGSIERPAHRLACGAIAVRFGSGGAADTIIVGSGEPWRAEGVPAERRTDGQPGQPFGGVGIVIGEHDAASASVTWVREAANLVGQGVYRVALEPGGERIVVATTRGLYEQPAQNAGTAWTHVAGAPFDELEVDCSDVLWTAGDGTVPPRLWAWVARGANAGLWMSATNASLAWQRITTPGTAARRAVLASASPQEVWLFCDHSAEVTRLSGEDGEARTPRAAAAPTLPALRADCGRMYRSSDIVRQGFVSLIESGALVPVTYSLVQGRAIFEGDIDLGPEEEMARLRAAVQSAGGGGGTPPGNALRGVVITGDRYRWPGGIVPWVTTAALRPRVERAIAHWESRTRIRFVERVAANSAFYPNWVSFESVDGCSSAVGMQGTGKQVISLADGCDVGATVHEIGHALGLWHEQSRQDRNNHVRVVAENIKPGKGHNFDQHIADGDDVGAYDYASLMHYARDAFSKNGKDTIVPLGGQSIGQSDGLSAGDVAAIRSIYPDLQRPLLFRVAAGATPVARPVLNVPDLLGQSGSYAIALAVDPARLQRVILGGARYPATDGRDQPVLNERRLDDAAVLLADVGAAPNGMLEFGRPSAPMSLGAGVYAHVHDLVFSNGGARLWVACDGGVYRSDLPVGRFRLTARNSGLPVIEANDVVGHPICEGRVLASAQGHGIVERHSGAAWRCVGSGVGGGAAFDPTQPARYVNQVERGRWRSSHDVFALRLPRGEDDAAHCASHSVPALVTRRRPGAPAGQQDVTQVIIGTSRLWYSEDFGKTWVTLPGATAPPAGNLGHDGFGQKITVCSWQSSEVAWVLGEGRLKRYARTAGSDTAGGPGAWTAEVIIEKGVKAKKDTTTTDGPIRDSAAWTDIAVNLDAPDTARGTRGALYLGTIGNADNAAVDTLWWFDGTNRWHATGLRREGVPAPVLSIVCDPAFPDEVYVGTTIGVWKGVRTQLGDVAPAWTWHARLNGLPEAAVEDLAIFSRDGLRLLRAAIAARGVWELRLDMPDLEDRVYLRAHDDDLRHTSPAVAVQADGRTPRSWHGSPDVRPRRAPLAIAPPATLPWAAGSPGVDAEPLRRFQSALRARTRDSRVRATGRWDSWFNEVMRDLGAPTVAPATVRLDEAFWTLSMQGAPATAEPWDTPRPTHADLLDFSAGINEGVRERTSCELPAAVNKVDILVHQRGLAPLDGAEVRVTLLKWVDPSAQSTASWSDSSTWFSGPVPWADAVNATLNAATVAAGPALGSGWSYVGDTLATRRQTLAGQTLDALHPGIASFDLNLSGLKHNTVVLLVAVIRFGADIALTAASLEQLAMNSPNVAVRSLRVEGFSTAQGSSTSPFSTRIYPDANDANAPKLVPSVAQNARLAAALATVRGTLPAANQARLDKIALIVLKLTPSGPIDYAGVRETEMFFSASLLKVSLLYASFELVARVNALAPSITAATAAEFLDKVKRDFSPKIENAVPRIKPGAWRKVAFDQALTATAAGPNQFRVSLSAKHDADLRKIFTDQTQNTSPRDTMHRLGYCYVNRALDAAGFFDLQTETGIWMATDYGNWQDFNVPVATKNTARPPKNGTSSAAMTALAMANLFAHMHRGLLISPAASTSMREIFRAGGAWLTTLPNKASFSFTDDGAKVGHSASGSAFVGSVMSEAAFLDRKSDAAHFLAVWQNVPDELNSEPIYRVLDEMIKNWP